MTQDNTKFGYYCSLALHISVTVAAIVAVLMQSIFDTKDTEPIVPFEMVEPSPTPPAPEIPQETLPEITQQDKIKPIDPIDLPEPQPEPPPEPQPEPQPQPKPSPKPKPKPKVEQQKQISFRDFSKKNPIKQTSSIQPRRQAPVKVGKITAKTSNVDSIANITAKSGSSAAMKNLLDGYVKEIHRRAKSNWAIPVTAQGIDYATKIEFKVSKNGVISGLRVVSSSENTEFDNSVMAAIRSITLPPPPDNEPHTVYITFIID